MAIKKQNYSTYGYEGYELTKTGLHKASITLVAHKTNITDLTTSVGILHKQLASEGLRQINIDGTGRQAWAIDGFKVKNIKVGSNIAVAIINVELCLNDNDWLKDVQFNLSDNFGTLIIDNNGNNITVKTN